MSNTIQIAQNTLLKLVIRSGLDSDRQKITLDVGELGYTTDHKRLYVGDGTTAGGVLVGNVFNGSRTSITSSPGNPKTGDYAFDTSSNGLYRFISGDPTVSSNWQLIGAIPSAYDTTLSASGTKFKVNSLSAFNISSDALGNSLQITSGRVALSSTIAIDRITSSRLYLSENISISGIDYVFPSKQVANGYLQTDGSGNLKWNSINTLLSSASATLTTGPGLSVFVNGVGTTSALLLTSAQIQIKGNYIPSAHVTFDQAGNITKSSRVASVQTRTYLQLSAYPQFPGDINGVPLQQSNSQYDYNRSVASGAYLITLNDIYYVSNSDITVQAKNASYRFDNNGSYFADSNLNYNYFVRSSTGSTTTFDQVVVFFYTPTTYIQTAGEGINTYTGPGLLTAGYANNRTRFGVSIYGDVQ